MIIVISNLMFERLELSVISIELSAIEKINATLSISP